MSYLEKSLERPEREKWCGQKHSQKKKRERVSFKKSTPPPHPNLPSPLILSASLSLTLSAASPPPPPSIFLNQPGKLPLSSPPPLVSLSLARCDKRVTGPHKGGGRPEGMGWGGGGGLCISTEGSTHPHATPQKPNRNTGTQEKAHSNPHPTPPRRLPSPRPSSPLLSCKPITLFSLC